MLEWNVKEYDFNRKEIYDVNILRYSQDLIKNLKKKYQNKKAFSEALKREMMYRYWSKCEHELIISEDEMGLIWLSPWVGDDSVRIDVSRDLAFNWQDFAHKHIKTQIFEHKAKIDVFDQLQYKWEEFVDYCLYTHLPYERKGWWNND